MSVWIKPDARGIVDRQPQPYSLGLQKGSIVKLAGIEWCGDRGDLTGRFDGLACADLRSVTDDHDQCSARRIVPARAVAQGRDVEHEAGCHLFVGSLADAKAVFSVAQSTRFGHHASKPSRPGRFSDATGQIVGALVGPTMVMPAATDRGDRRQH